MPLNILQSHVQARVRSAVAGFYDATGTIYRPTRTPGGATGQVLTYPSAGTTPMRFDPTSANNDPSLAKNALDGAGMMTFPYNADVRATDRIGYGGDTYEIIKLDDSDSWKIDLRADVVKVNASS